MAIGQARVQLVGERRASRRTASQPCKYSAGGAFCDDRASISVLRTRTSWCTVSGCTRPTPPATPATVAMVVLFVHRGASRALSVDTCLIPVLYLCGTGVIFVLYSCRVWVATLLKTLKTARYLVDLLRMDGEDPQVEL